jgi:carbonic anhydrase
MVYCHLYKGDFTMSSESAASHASDPSNALNDLVEGHMRYLSGQMLHPHTGHVDMVNVASGQAPKICILACADSRVPPELIFDQGLGDMFVVRVAGNFADEDNQASLEYAVQHFDPPPAIIVVLGHERCGAIQGAVITFDSDSMPPDMVEEFNKYESSDQLKRLIGKLEHAVTSTKGQHSSADYLLRIDDAVRQNVRDNVTVLRENVTIKQAGTEVVGARYDLDTGEIEWLW